MRRTPLAALMLTTCAAVVAAAAGDLVSGPASGTPDTQYSNPDQAARRISLADFKKLHDTGDVIVLDVRGADAYRIGHIPGAVSVPLDTVAAKAAEWKTATRPVVTYCT